MTIKTHLIMATFLLILMGALIQAQTTGQTGKTGSANSNQLGAAQINAGAAAVTGNGTPGRLTKWLGSSTSSYVVGDSLIFEDKYGKVGIGTLTPTSLFTVQGMIETTLGGYKFPDGTVQTTAAVSGLQSISHDDTLKGEGTAASPLGIKVPLLLQGTREVLTAFTTNDSCIGCSAINGKASSNGIGVSGAVTSYSPVQNTGVQGVSDNGYGVIGQAYTGVGVVGVGFTSGLAGKFYGDVQIVPGNQTPGNLSVSGMLSKGGGSFKIDHPLDPENKYLYHSFVESPDMKNIYDGVATLDTNGEAVVRLPEWFEALNGNYRYLLTAIGAPAPGLYVAEKLSHNQFKIAGGAPGLEVSWQVTGIRQDAYANANRIKVEVDKPEHERGTYLHPEALGKPAERSVEWARNPELMRQMKEAATAAQKRENQ